MAPPDSAELLEKKEESIITFDWSVMASAPAVVPELLVKLLPTTLIEEFDIAIPPEMLSSTMPCRVCNQQVAFSTPNLINDNTVNCLQSGSHSGNCIHEYVFIHIGMHDLNAAIRISWMTFLQLAPGVSY